jgi:hypothetical protein
MRIIIFTLISLLFVHPNFSYSCDAIGSYRKYECGKIGDKNAEQGNYIEAVKNWNTSYLKKLGIV